MCELFGMSARFPTTVHLSLDELAQHGGVTAQHADGWGIAFYEERDALVVREAERAAGSACVELLKRHGIQSPLVVAHLRKATQGGRALRNTQPFARELAGRMHVFAHNGMVGAIASDERFAAQRFAPIGETDSEIAFCALLERLATLWSDRKVPELGARRALVAAFARQLATLGPANFVYTDGDALFAHGHRRTQADGGVRPPGLYVLCRTCARSADAPALAGVTLTAGDRQEAGESPDDPQEVALVASVPLTSEGWRALDEGELVVLRAGRVVT